MIPTIENSLGRQRRKAEQCAVCEKLREEEHHFYARLALSCVESESAPEELLSEGFCNLHAWQFSRSADPENCGFIGRDLLRRYLQILSEMEWSGQITAACSKAQPVCLVCRFLVEKEALLLSETLNEQGLQPNGESSRKGHSFCRIHFFTLLVKTPSNELKCQFILDQIQSTVDLMKTLEVVPIAREMWTSLQTKPLICKS
jgi:hypothetical protein